MDNYFYNIASSILNEVYERGRPFVSNFLTLEEQEIIKSEAKKYPSLNVRFDGGIIGAEYKKAIISIYNKDISNEISIIKISFNPKYLTLSHRNILGTLIHLGIKRDRIGDIKIEDNCAYVAVSSNLVEFLILNLTEIHHQEVIVTEYFDKVELADTGIEKTIFVSSIRLDAVIAMAFNLSREESLAIIKREMVKVNQKITLKAFQNLNPCDIISVAHKGRIKIIDDTGTSRSGRIVMKIKIYR